MRLFGLASYRKPVVIEGTRPCEDAAADLASMIRPALHLYRRQRSGPFLGKLSEGYGRLFYYPNWRRAMGRTLVFRLEPHGEGCRLTGRLEVVKPVRIFTWAYVFFAVIGTLWVIVLTILHATKVDWLYETRLVMQGLLCAAIFLYGYTGLCVLMGTRTERLALKIIGHVLNNETAAPMILDLLA